MSEKCENKNGEGDCQEWPQDGELKANMNKTLNTLKRVSENGGDERVYAYVLTTVKVDRHGGFVQTGSAPNFQGGFITLCTCMRQMRTYRKADAWKDVWIAGFTGVNILGDHRNYLFYLLRVKEAFHSHKELWDWLDSTVKKAKNASRYKFDEVYEPLPNLTDSFDRNQYCEPIKEPKHVHFKNDQWFKDIDYINTKTKRRPALLVGAPDYSFLWSRPKIYFNDKLPRTMYLDNIREFITKLANDSDQRRQAPPMQSSAAVPD